MTVIHGKATQRLLVTGASGFIGQQLVPELRQRGFSVRAAVRRAAGGGEEISVGQIDANTDWSAALRDVDCVIHLAGRAHVLDDSESDALNAYRTINADGTRALADAAARAGVRRFIFISSIKVNGESTTDKPFLPDDEPLPSDPYGISKLEAEQSLWTISQRTGMEICVIRPPLVYGPRVRGNFQRLVKLIETGLPLPFGAVRNRRSFVSIYNLCDLIIRCIDAEAARGKVFLVSDGNDMSVGELIREIAGAIDRPARLIGVPPALLRFVFSAIFRRREYDRLCGSLQVDIEETCQLLDWRPPMSVPDSLRYSFSQ